MILGRICFAAASLALLLASFLTAALAHVGIGLLGAAGLGMDDDAYSGHGHEALAPVALLTASLLIYSLLRTVANALARRHHLDPLLAFARVAGRLNTGFPIVLVFGGALLTLVGMEFIEQVVAFGHVVGLADALGGDAIAGLSIVAALAALVTVVGLRFAHALAAAALVVSRIVAILVLALRLRSAGIRRILMRDAHCGVGALACGLLVRCFGLRAPPARTRPSPSSLR
jgi:hypothetical protein